MRLTLMHTLRQSTTKLPYQLNRRVRKLYTTLLEVEDSSNHHWAQENIHLRFDGYNPTLSVR